MGTEIIIKLIARILLFTNRMSADFAIEFPWKVELMNLRDNPTTTFNKNPHTTPTIYRHARQKNRNDSIFYPLYMISRKYAIP